MVQDQRRKEHGRVPIPSPSPLPNILAGMEGEEKEEPSDLVKAGCCAAASCGAGARSGLLLPQKTGG